MKLNILIQLITETSIIKDLLKSLNYPHGSVRLLSTYLEKT